MAFTVTFPTQGPLPEPEVLADWLEERGEALITEGSDTLALQAIPLRLVADDQGVRAHLDLTPTASVSRIVRVLFELSVRLGADVKLAGAGQLNRPGLWLRLADEQDRLRIADALGRAASMNQGDEARHALWSLLGAIGSGRDLRWDEQRSRVVELKEVGAENGLTVEEAAWHDAEAAEGDTVGVPVHGDVHILAWRWLSEAYPSLVVQ